MPLVPVAELDDPLLAWYRGVGDPDLLRRGGRFVVEGRRAVERLLASGRWPIESVLVSRPALATLTPALAAHLADLPVFVTDLERLVALAGYNIHRGCLAIGVRRPERQAEDLVPPAGEPAWLLGLEGLSDADNVGSCFRNAAAFGISGIVLDAACADPLYRKAIRTSAGATLQVPFVRTTSWGPVFEHVRAGGGRVVALTPSENADDLSTLPRDLLDAPRLLLVVGCEGAGLRQETMAASDRRVRIRMAPGIDSINVAAAAAVALHAFGGAGRRGC